MNGDKKCPEVSPKSGNFWTENFCSGSIFERVLNLFFFLVCIAGVSTSIYMNFVNRSLHLDEAWLAYSFSTRSFWTLWNGAFEWNQSAPLGWLYFEKLLTVIFGNTEFVLRTGSILGLALTLPCLYCLLAKCFHVKFALGACAFYANLPFILRYSTTFKPYVSDGLFVLLVILLFYLYEERRINAWLLGLGWAILIWFSNPTCFFEGGLLISSGLFALVRKDWKKIQSLFFVGLAIGISFIIYYFFWLREVAEGDFMQNYWEEQQFPLFPTSAADLSKIVSMLMNILCIFQNTAASVFALAILGLPLAILQKNKILIGSYTGLLIALTASSVGFFPVFNRLWCFFYVIAVFLAFTALYQLLTLPEKWRRLGFSVAVFFLGLLLFCKINPEESGNRNLLIFTVLRSAGISLFLSLIVFAIYKRIIYVRRNFCERFLIGLMAFLLVMSVDGIPKFLQAENVYLKNEELDTEVRWLHKNVQKGEKVYVQRYAVAGFQYKNGYGNTSVGGFENNVEFGKVDFKPGTGYETELATILSNNHFYAVCTHVPPYDERTLPLIDAMRKERILELVSFEHETPLWFCCTDPKDRKTHVTGKLLEPSEKDGVMTATLELRNDGMTWLNHWYEDLALLNQTTGEQIPFTEENIAPGRTIQFGVQWEKGQTPTFDLVNEFGPVFSLEQLAVEE